MNNRHVLRRGDVNLEQLGEEFTQRLGRRVALSALLPENNPDDEAGLLVLIGEDGGELDVPSATVQAVIRRHRPQAPAVPADPLDVFEEALSKAQTVEDLRDALLSWVADQRARSGGS